MEFRTEQEKFWAGSFGDDYVDRNSSVHSIAGNVAFFSEVFQGKKIESVVEFGPNVGMNLKALKTIYPDLKCGGVEINNKAADILERDKTFEGNIDIYRGSILDYRPQKEYELSLIKGVLIHINPSELEKVYDKLYESSKKYILIAEYYSRTPESLKYRGATDKLFKRDFAGEFLDRFPSVDLVDYGFSYYRDPLQLQDDITWFLLEKKTTNN